MSHAGRVKSTLTAIVVTTAVAVGAHSRKLMQTPTPIRIKPSPTFSPLPGGLWEGPTA